MNNTHPPTSCPHCSHLIDSAVDPANPAVMPAPGDFTLCAYCGGICKYTDALELRSVTNVDIADCEPSVLRQLAIMQDIVRSGSISVIVG